MNKDIIYKDYLDRHISGVVSAYETIVKPILIDEGFDRRIIREIYYLTLSHDLTKYTDPEYGPYRDHFCDPDNYPKDSKEYIKAWNHHQKFNPHHWQHWVLLNDIDNPKILPIDMEFKYIIEMICDWISASNHYGSTAYKWYNEQKNNMILSDNTRRIIEHYLKLI